MKQDLDMELIVPKFNCFCAGKSVSIEEVQHAFDLAIQSNTLLLHLPVADTEEGVSISSMRVA